MKFRYVLTRLIAGPPRWVSLTVRRRVGPKLIGSSERDRHPREPDLELRFGAFHARLVDDVLGNPREQLFQQNNPFEARRVRADTEVHAMAEAEMARHRARHIEAVGLRELAFVAIRRDVEHEHSF